MSAPSQRLPSSRPRTIGMADWVGSSAAGSGGLGRVQSTTAEPQASPAPNAVSSSRWPGRIWPCSQASAMAMGMEAAEVLP